MYKLLVKKTSQNKRTNIKRYHTLIFSILLKIILLCITTIFPEKLNYANIHFFLTFKLSYIIL